MIRDKIVVGVAGVANGELSKKLQLTPKLTVTEALETIRTYEYVLQQQELQRVTPDKSVDLVSYLRFQ